VAFTDDVSWYQITNALFMCDVKHCLEDLAKFVYIKSTRHKIKKQ